MQTHSTSRVLDVIDDVFSLHRHNAVSCRNTSTTKRNFHHHTTSQSHQKPRIKLSFWSTSAMMSGIRGLRTTKENSARHQRRRTQLEVYRHQQNQPARTTANVDDESCEPPSVLWSMPAIKTDILGLKTKKGTQREVQKHQKNPALYMPLPDSHQITVPLVHTGHDARWA